MASGETGNVVGAGARVKGRITGPGSLTVDGAVEGEVRLEGDLVVNPSGRVAAPVSGANVSVWGTIQGSISAARTVTVGPGAVVEGDLTAPSITIHPDARLTGRVHMELDLPKGASRGRPAQGRW
ncbi:MAG: polymer-forming cytoskeletal protein [Deltaproteobacteria bacterium]|nr:polymer-forming cytoskeletal protein [Deltaproteobacteria bacterium]MCB9786723.1 polymer-forming cytoskeletal protein [Deltaproteobacteria bacterium]